MNVYFISGLAADRTVFKNLILPAHCTAVYLDWIEPQPEETLAQYAQRLSATIDKTSPFALIGLSFGGMIAIEIANRLQPAVTILISSIPGVHGLPFYYHFAKRLRLHKLVPISALQQLSLLKRLFTTETSEDKRLLKAMIRNSNPKFIRWCLHAILTWDSEKVPQRLVHIHGTRDEVLPMRFVKPTHIIKGGGHLLVLNRAKEVNKILKEVLMENAYPA